MVPGTTFTSPTLAKYVFLHYRPTCRPMCTTPHWSMVHWSTSITRSWVILRADGHTHARTDTHGDSHVENNTHSYWCPFLSVSISSRPVDSNEYLDGARDQSVRCCRRGLLRTADRRTSCFAAWTERGSCMAVSERSIPFTELMPGASLQAEVAAAVL